MPSPLPAQMFRPNSIRGLLARLPRHHSQSLLPPRRIQRFFLSTLRATETRPSSLARSPFLSARFRTLANANNRNPTLSSITRNQQPRRSNSSKSNPPPPPPPPSGSTLSFSQRMKNLSREYGWAALGIYLTISALDFPFCFLAVRLLGVERIGHYEHVVVENMKRVMATVWPVSGASSSSDPEGVEGGELAIAGVSGAETETYVDEARKRSNGEASIWAQLAIAYALHKSLIFIRVPLTAAVTPTIVRVLRKWGWNIGKRKPKAT
ncbi:hypothetical protein AJ80_07933 [Polytolypa hystricis UAMH7299]|uniref:DUF1279 domain-containing protein n=1 Tax=Polytolypa hystricis (strain UAMH7299) TaxID=1447883 RepID=A0A2B7XGW9_POLH7|nr:hypothetical protein AJ80_07933 [Polytolypa hystricis UAMH7299]